MHIESQHEIQHTYAIYYFVKRALSSTKQLNAYLRFIVKREKKRYTEKGLLFLFRFVCMSIKN